MAEANPTWSRTDESALKHWDLRALWIASFGSLVAAFPIYSICVFMLGMDRDGIADVFALQVTVAYWVGIFAAMMPLPSLRQWSRFRRLQTVCLTFMIVSYATHLSWELIWLLFHDAISQARDSMWAYPWWAYIDGGDMRYYNPDVNLLTIEVISVINGCVGITGLVLLWRSRFADYRGTLLCLATAVAHTVMTWYYYGTEILSGFASVNTASFMDLWVKFIFLNGPWLVLPWFVMAWGVQLLKKQLSNPQYHQ